MSRSFIIKYWDKLFHINVYNFEKKRAFYMFFFPRTSTVFVLVLFGYCLFVFFFFDLFSSLPMIVWYHFPRCLWSVRCCYAVKSTNTKIKPSNFYSSYVEPTKTKEATFFCNKWIQHGQILVQAFWKAYYDLSVKTGVRSSRCLEKM